MSVAAPQNLAEVEGLIQRLYKPGHPSVISDINNELQKLQLSQDGWQMADALMASGDVNVRFFGALTFTVKLNNDGPSLDAETAQSVLLRLLHWLVRLVGQGESGLVYRKLCSALTTFLVRSSMAWTRPIVHLARCFGTGNALPLDNDVDANLESSTLSSVGPLQLNTLLYFSGVMADEIGRLDANASTSSRLHAEMELSVRDVSNLLDFSFHQTPHTIKEEALRTFLAWINYAQPTWPGLPEALQYLRDLIGPAAECLTDKEAASEAMDVFRDVLEGYTSFFKPEHMNKIARIIYDHVQPALVRALHERDTDGQHVIYGQFVIAFACANIQQVVEEPSRELGSQVIVKLHFDILAAEGYPGDDDQLSTLSIEFWNTYVEYVNDALFSSDAGDAQLSWMPQAKATLNQAFQLIWKKMLTPPADVVQNWSDEERDGFKEFRSDASDLLLSIFVLLTKDMLRDLVNITMQSLEARHWQAVEASLFCLKTLADNVLEDPANEGHLQKVFESSLFRDVADFSLEIPTHVRRTAIDFIGLYGQYIERHAEFLPEAIRFLFASLETPSLANTAAKSIAALCSTCRANLTSELPDFLAQYPRFLASANTDQYTREKVIGAIAAIIQALSPESAKVEPLLILLRHVEMDIEKAKHHAAAGEAKEAEDAGVGALQCLVSMGKGMQAPDDVPIDIYDDDEEISKDKSTYWTTGNGESVQQRIVSCFSILEVVGGHSAAIDAVCQVLRSGYAEIEPGPFVLPVSVTVSLVQQCSISTPQLETVLSTASVLITQHSARGSSRIDAEVGAIYEAVIKIMQQLGHPREDPMLAAASLELCYRLPHRYAHILFANAGTITLDFALSALTEPDALPKRWACELFSRLFSIKHSPPDAAAGPMNLQAQIDMFAVAYGPKFAHAMVLEIGGLAARSELDTLCEPLKTFLLHQSKATVWLQESIASAAFIKPRVTSNDKEVFVRQLRSVQSDGRRLKEVVKTFWAACRGTVVKF